MINNAGLTPQAPLERLKVDEWDHMIDVNIKGVLYGIAAAASHAATEGRSLHQCFVSRRSTGRSRLRRLCGDEARRARAFRGTSAGSQTLQYSHDRDLARRGRTELPNGISDSGAAERVRIFYSQVAVPADSFARVVAFAMSQPENVDINEVLYRPTKQDF